MAFQNKLMSADATADKVSEPITEEKVCEIHGIPNCESCFDAFGMQEDQNDEGWMGHKLVFAKDLKGKDLMQRKDNIDDYVVIDPRQRGAQVAAEELEKKQKAKEKQLGEAFRKRERDDSYRDRRQDYDDRKRSRSDSDRKGEYGRRSEYEGRSGSNRRRR
jgi:peptidyl-prolyl cis-trans isomerase SDCCAG10